MFTRAALFGEGYREPRLLFVAQPARLGGPARQTREHDGNEQQRRPRGDDEHPLPSANPAAAVEFEQQPADRRTPGLGQPAPPHHTPQHTPPPPPPAPRT